MSREIRSRDVSLNALSLMTGCLTAAALVGTGLVTGLAADATAQKNQAKVATGARAASRHAAAVSQCPVTAPRPAATAAAAPMAVVQQSKPIPLPTRTVVITRIVRTVSLSKAQVGR